MLPVECEGCENATNIYFVFNASCRKLAEPEAQHTRLGGCAMRTHGLSTSKEQVKVWVDPLKASKKAAKSMLKQKKAAGPKKAERRDQR